MHIVLIAIVTLWVAAALVLAFAGSQGTDVERALRSDEPVTVWSGMQDGAAVRADEDVAVPAA